MAAGAAAESVRTGDVVPSLAASDRGQGAELFDTLAISSNHRPFFWFGEMEAIFRWISKVAFKRPLSEFTLHSEWGASEVKRFCDSVEAHRGRGRSAVERGD